VEHTKVTLLVSLPIVIVSFLLAQTPGRYSGGSHKILSEDEATQPSLMLSLLAGKFEDPGDPAAALATCVCDGIDNKLPFTVIFVESSLNSILSASVPVL
jgi:hypothetical protein